MSSIRDRFKAPAGPFADEMVRITSTDTENTRQANRVNARFSEALVVVCSA
jgi:hypothetical protein